MLRHYSLIAFRSFARFKTTFVINVIGLSTGLACTVLIYLWVQDELGIDAYHTQGDRLYQVMTNHHNAGGIVTMDATPDPLAETLAAELPEIEFGTAATPSSWFGDFVLENGDTKVKASGEFAGNDYFKMFTLPVLQGDASKLLTDNNSVAISESLAKKIFNTTDVVGKTMVWRLVNLNNEVIITGVFQDLPSSSSERFDFLLSFNYWTQMLKSKDNWGNFNASGYILLKDGVDAKQLGHKIEAFLKTKDPNSTVTLLLQQYSEKYLHGRYVNGQPSGGRIEYVRLFSIIAAFILATACINFMNLSTARASRRMKEIGIKKAFGVSRKSLAFQYLSESLCMSMICMIIALMIAVTALPLFSSITAKTLTIDWSPVTMLTLFGIAVVTGILAGSYPALFLSGFAPGDILKGKTSTSTGEAWARKGLVVFQFCITIILVSSVLVVYKQIEFVQNRSVGFDKDHVIHFQKEGAIADKLEVFLEELRALSEVAEASAISQNVTDVQAFTTGIAWPGKDDSQEVKFNLLNVQPRLVETLGIEIVAGRSFSEEFHDTSSRLLFNEAAIRAMGLKDPVGQHVNVWGEEREIIGVLKDFNFQSLHETVKPVIVMLATQPLDVHHVVVKLKADSKFTGIEKVTELYQAFNPGYSFDYRFLDDDVQRQYSAEMRVASLSKYFAGLAIIISCLGLFGLATFTAEKRQKEIGIRKVLGCSNVDVVLLLSGQFTRIVLVAAVIAVPVSYLATREWLGGFAFRIELQWWYFAAAGLVALCIAWATVGSQAIRAASARPTEVLRSE